MTEILTAENLLALLTLTALEIVLGIDNIVFIAIVVGKLPPAERPRIRSIGLGLAMFLRIALLLALSWIIQLTDPIFSVLSHPFSGRDLILLAGGIFLIGKATFEIHHKLEPEKSEKEGAKSSAKSTFGILVQILILDLVFSLDSVITAVGMAQALWVMIVAVVIAVLVMLVFSGKISDFIERHPTFKMLALSFLMMIGVMLVADGCGQHVDKGYIYFAMGFSLLVETLNIRVRRKH